MTEQQVKFFCKFAVEMSDRPFTEEEKELLRQAIDKSQNLEELILVAIASLNLK